ncbi:MAG TPA: hypothetical protein VME01_00360 [Solirubrobacteraceae bacterium]|nr:hypothetical protein [Solirubrobacteraceae bacterium]
MRIRPLLSIVLLALAGAALLAACGSSGKKPAHRSGGDPLIAFSKCMRTHGVPNFPDPSGSGGGIQIGGTGVNPSSPSFRAAQATCFKLMPGGGPGNQHPSAAQVKQADQMAACMRQHGFTNFPDPIVSSQPPTNLNPANFSLVEDRGGIVTELPHSINPQSPAFQSAAKTCHFS